MHSRAQKNERVFRACGGVLEHGVVLLHKPVPKVPTHVLQPVLEHGVVLLHKPVTKVQTHVLQPVHDQADGMKNVFVF